MVNFLMSRRAGDHARGGQRPDSILLVGTYRTAVSVVRALARRGRWVEVGLENTASQLAESGGAEFSRHASAMWHHPSIRNAPDDFLEALVRKMSASPGPVHVLPLHEQALVLLATQRHRLPAHVSLAVPATDNVMACLDKQVCLDVAASAGVSAPPWEVVRSHSELLAAVDAVGSRVVVKPLWPMDRVLTGRKAIVCEGSSELVRHLPAWPEGHDRLLVQRWADGARHDLLFAARDGELIDLVEKETTRTQRRDGTGLAVAGYIRPVGERRQGQLAALLAALRYTGVGFAQFLARPGDDGGAFIELNPRISGSNIIADRAGLDLANYAIDLAAGMSMRHPVEAPCRRDGLTYAWTFGDLSGLLYSVANRELGRADALAELSRILSVGLRAKAHTTWSWRDPMPALVSYARHAAMTGKRRIRRSLR